jgi:DNA modification methylase
MGYRILLGDCLETLATLPAGSVQCCVTSPPYFGLRSYGGGDAEIGREDTPDAYVARLVDVFRAVRRVLRDDGTLWLNLGDSYAGGGGGNYGGGKSVRSQGGQQVTNVRNRSGWLSAAGAKPKDLLMIPARVALGLQADGWYLRSEIVWNKPNPMPESVRDRPTSAHEKVFLLTKSPAYFYDIDAVREPHGADSLARVGRGRSDAHKWSDGGPGGQTLAADISRACHPNGRNARNVWTITPKGYRGAHFATMPVELAERCIRAGSRVGDAVLDPFGGAGTTALAAQNLGRDAVLCELNPEYVALAEERLSAPARVVKARAKVVPVSAPEPLPPLLAAMAAE